MTNNLFIKKSPIDEDMKIDSSSQKRLQMDGFNLFSPSQGVVINKDLLY